MVTFAVLLYVLCKIKAPFILLVLFIIHGVLKFIDGLEIEIEEVKK